MTPKATRDASHKLRNINDELHDAISIITTEKARVLFQVETNYNLN